MECVCNFISSDIDYSYVCKNTNTLVDDKFYGEEMLQNCFDKFFEAEKVYDNNYDSNIYFYKVKLKDETITVKFDKENMYHLFGIPNYRKIIGAVIMRKVLLDKYNVDINKDNCDDILIGKIKNIDHLKMISDVFSKYGEEIKQFDCDELNIKEDKLNWDKILFKLFCFLNIGDLSYGPTSYYIKDVKKGMAKEILLKRDLVLGDNCEYSLTIQFLEEMVLEKGSGFKRYFYSPKSIRIEKIPRSFKYIREDNKINVESFKYGGEVLIEKKENQKNKLKVKEDK